MGKAAFVFMLVFWALMLIPCVGVGWLGKRLIEDLGRYPSKTPAIQTGILFKLAIIEIVSVSLILSFFKALVSE